MKYFVFLFVICTISFTSCARRVINPSPGTKVVFVETPPVKHRVVVVKGKKYYHWNGKYYQKTKTGYVAVKI